MWFVCADRRGMYNYEHTDACRHTPPPAMEVSFPPLTTEYGHGLVVYTSPDAVGVVEAGVAGFACGHMLTMMAATPGRVRYARKADADCIGFVGPLDDEAYEVLAEVGCTGYTVLVAAPGHSFDEVVSRVRATDNGPFVSEIVQG